MVVYKKGNPNRKPSLVLMTRQNFYLLLIQGDSDSIMPLFPVLINKENIVLAVAPYVATTDHLLLWLPKKSTGLEKN